MKPDDPLSKALHQWQPKNPHALPKFVSDTMREIRLLDARPWWKARLDGLSEGLDTWILEWLPAPRMLVPVAAALVLALTAWQWIRVDSQAGPLAALKWQQSGGPAGASSLAGVYARSVKE